MYVYGCEPDLTMVASMGYLSSSAIIQRSSSASFFSRILSSSRRASCMYVCMYVCMYNVNMILEKQKETLQHMYVCVCIYVYKHVCVCIYVLNICKCMYYVIIEQMDTYVSMYMYVYVYV